VIKNLKRALLNSPLRSLYIGLAGAYHSARRLFIYPPSANVGKIDYEAYWDEKFAGKRGHMSSWRLRRAKAFASLVNPGDHVLDLGVGDGALLKYLIEERHIIGSGLDVSQQAVAFCREQGLDVSLADVNQPIGSFIQAPHDFVIMSEIIEHLPEPETLLDSLRPYARKGLIVSIPNTGFYQHRLRLLFGKFPLQWIVTPGEHLRFWTLADFRWWARQMRFKIVHEIPYQGTPGLCTVMPGLFAAAFVYMLENNK
jgi:methionine biosynthesis protein MetW